jgi:hypothetical protein
MNDKDKTDQDKTVVRHRDESVILLFGFLCISTIAALLGKLFLGKLIGFLADLGVAFLHALPDILAGVVIGGLVVACGFLLLVVYVAVVEVGERRRARLPEYLRAVPVLAPRTLRWVGCLLPVDDGLAWLIEVASCLAETSDKKSRRQYVRSYWRGVPQLIWTSWAEYLGAGRRRELL